MGLPFYAKSIDPEERYFSDLRKRVEKKDFYWIPSWTRIAKLGGVKDVNKHSKDELVEVLGFTPEKFDQWEKGSCEDLINSYLIV